jgi:undecaprenyl-diphosphatase
MKRRWAGQFSFFIAIPPILGASALKITEVARTSTQVSWGPVVLGSVTAAVVGYGALRLLLAAVRRARLKYFAVYCFALGLLAIAGGLTGYFEP